MSTPRNRRIVLGIVAVLVLAIGGAIALVGRSVHNATWRTPVIWAALEVAQEVRGQPPRALVAQADGRLQVRPEGFLTFSLAARPVRYPFLVIALGDATATVEFDAPGTRGGFTAAHTPDGWRVAADAHDSVPAGLVNVTLIASDRRLTNAMVADILAGGQPTDLSDKGAMAGDANLSWPAPPTAAAP